MTNQGKTSSPRLVLGAAISSSIRAFGSFGESYPLYLDRPPSEDVISFSDLFAPDRLTNAFHRAIGEWCTDPGAEDVRAGASRFMRRYCASAAMTVLLPLANGAAVDLTTAQVAFLIRAGMPSGTVIDADVRDFRGASDRPTNWPISGRREPSEAALRNRALRSLVEAMLRPAFEITARVARIPWKLLWSTAAEQVDMMYDHAAQRMTADEFGPLKKDRESILFGPELPGVDGPNPMLGLLTWEDGSAAGFERPLQVRRHCCVCYVIEGREPSYCRTCGLLSREERLALWHRWRGTQHIAPPQP